MQWNSQSRATNMCREQSFLQWPNTLCEAHHYKDPGLAGFPLWPASWKHRKLHHEVDTIALKNNIVIMATCAWGTLLLTLIFYVYWLCLWFPPRSWSSVIALIWENEKEPLYEEYSLFVLQQVRGGIRGIGCCTYCLTLQMLQLQVDRNKTSLSLSRESQKHQSSPAAGSFRANGSDRSVIEHQGSKKPEWFRRDY